MATIDMDRIRIGVSGLSEEIQLYQSMKNNANVALHRRYATAEFYRALICHQIGKAKPEVGEGVETDFNLGDERYLLVLKRLE